MKNANYITIQGWMRNVLQLKGNELIVYALLYGFSQDGESEFTGSVAYIAKWTGTSKQTVHNVLRSLCEKKLIKKSEKYHNGVKFCSYVTTLPVVKNFDGGVVKKFDGGSQKTLPNNINDKNNNKNNKGHPSIEDVKAYCEERNNGIDPEAFIDYYAQQGWKLANGNLMKDWKASVRTWERRNKTKAKEEIKPKRYKEFEPDQEVDAVQMPEEIRNRLNSMF